MVSHGEFEKFGFRLSFIVHVGNYFQLIIGEVRFMKIICVEKSRKLYKLTEKQTSTFLGTLPAHALHYCNRTAVCGDFKIRVMYILCKELLERVQIEVALFISQTLSLLPFSCFITSSIIVLMDVMRNKEFII